MRMRVAVIVILAAILPVAMVWSEGQKDSKPAAGSKADKVVPELGPYIARLGVKGEVLFTNCWGGPRIPQMEKQIKDFNVYYPGVTIKSDVGVCADLEKKYIVAIAAGSPQDVIMLQSNQMPSFVEQNALMPLDDFIARDQLNADVFFPGEIATHRYKGKTYSLPNVTAGAWHFVWWNKDKFAEAGLDRNKGPETWQDLERMADTVKQKLPGIYFLEHTHAFSIPAFVVFLYANNGQFMSTDMKKVLFNSEEGVQTLEWMLQFGKRQTKSGKFEEMADRTRSVKDVIDYAVLVAGKNAAMITGAWTFNQFRDAAPGKEFGLALFPYNNRNPKAKYRTPAHGGWGFAIPRGVSKERAEAAWEWLKYATAGEGNHGFTKAQARPSPVQKYNQDPDQMKGNPHVPTILKDFTINEAMPVTAVHPQILEIIWNMTDEAMFEKAPPRDVLNKAAAEAQKILDAWWAKQR